MKAIKLYEEIGRIGDDLIEEVENIHPVNKKIVWRKYCALAACLCVAVLTAVITIPKLRNTTSQPSWPVKEVPLAKEPGDETYQLPKWEDLGISQQYSMLLLDNAEYYGTICKIDKEQLGDSIGENTFSGLDNYTEEIRYKDGTIYAIRGIEKACAVAVQFDNDTDYYVYRSSDYKPGTLGQLINALNLRDNMTFGSIWYEYRKEDGTLATIEFADAQSSVIWEMLLADENVENVKDYDGMQFETIMSISVNIPIVGYENISLSVTKNGYITTNILDTGKAFYIGEDKTQEFVDYVLKECKGYEIVYVDTDECDIPE